MILKIGEYMKVLVDQEAISLFRSKIIMQINSIEEAVRKMELLKNDLVWQGESHDRFIAKYDNNIKDIKEKMLILMEYIDFLKVFNSKYDKAINNIKNIYIKASEVDYNGK